MDDDSSEDSNLRAEFLIRDVIHKMQLTICNVVSLGSFEYASSLLHLHYKLTPIKAITLLDKLIEEGPSHEWIQSDQVISSAHLRWLCLTLKKDLQLLDTKEEKGRFYSLAYKAGVRDEVAVSNNKSSKFNEYIQALIEFDVLLASSLMHGSTLSPLNPFLCINTVQELRRKIYTIIKIKHDSANHSPTSKPSSIKSPSLSFLPLPNYLPKSASIFYSSNEMLNGLKCGNPEENEEASISLSPDTLEDIKHVISTQGLYGEFLIKNILSLLQDSQGKNKNEIQFILIQLSADRLLYEDYVDFYRLFMLLIPNIQINLLRRLISITWELFYYQEMFFKSNELFNEDDDEDNKEYKHPNEVINKLKRLAGYKENIVVESKPDSFITTENNSLKKGRLYEAALSNGLITELINQEDKFISQIEGHYTLPFPFLTLHENKQESYFWGQYLSLTRVIGEHCLEYVINNALHCLEAHQYRNAAVLLDSFPQLRPLVLLLIFDQLSNDVSGKQNLFKYLWDDYYLSLEDETLRGYQLSSCPSLEIWCSQQSYWLRFSLWYVRHFQNLLNIKINDHVDSVVTQLQSHSIPFVIREHLSKLDPLDLFKWLQSYPCTDANGRERMSKQKHQYDVMFLHMFYVISGAFEIVALQHRNQLNESNLTTFKVKTENHLNSITNYRMKFIALQFLFQSIFLKVNHLKNNTNNNNTASNLHVSSLELIECFLNIISNCLPSESDIYSLLSLDNTLQKDFETLSKFTKEGLTRVKVILTCNENHFRRSNVPKMSLLVSDPLSLVNIYIKNNKFNEAIDLVSFFGLPASHHVHIRLAKEIFNLKKILHNNREENDIKFSEISNSILSIVEKCQQDVIVYNFTLESIFTLLDFAVSSSVNFSQCKTLIKTASGLITNLKDICADSSVTFHSEYLVETKDRNNFFSFLSTFVTYLMTLLETKREHYFKLIQSFSPSTQEINFQKLDSLNLAALLSDTETVPTEPSLLTSHVEEMQSKYYALSALKNIVTLSQQKNSDNVHLDNLVQGVIASFNKENNKKKSIAGKDDVSIIQDISMLPNIHENKGLLDNNLTINSTNIMNSIEMDYLQSFLQYIVKIGNSLRLTLGDSRENSILLFPPREILRRVIFTHHAFEESVKLSSIMHLDLIKLILRGPTETAFVVDMKVIQFLSKLEAKTPVKGLIYSDTLISTLAGVYLPCLPSSQHDLLQYAVQKSSQMTKDFDNFHQWTILQSYFYFLLLQIQSDLQIKDSALNDADIKLSHLPQSFLDLKSCEDLTLFFENNFNISLSDDFHQKFQSIQSSLEKQTDLFMDLLDLLIEKKCFQSALSLSDSILKVNHVRKDVILSALAEEEVDKNRSDEKAHVYISRMQNNDKAASLTINNITKFNLEVALSLLHMHRQKQIIDLELLNLVEFWIVRLETYKEILSILDCNSWNTWQDLHLECKNTELKSVVEFLVKRTQFALAKTLITLQLQEECNEEVCNSLYEYVIGNQILFTLPIDLDAALVLVSECANLCIDILYVVIDKCPSTSFKLILVQFLLYSSNVELSMPERQKWKTRETSLHILLKLPLELQNQFLHLMSFPLCIIETLIMIGLIDIVKDVFFSFPELKNNDILIRAAIDCIFVNNCQLKTNKAKEIGDEMVEYNGKSYPRLTGNDDEDKNIRIKIPFDQGRQHISFVFSILSLCASAMDVGFATLSIADHISTFLFHQGSLPKGTLNKTKLLTNIIKSILLFGRENFANEMLKNDSSGKLDVIFPNIECNNNNFKDLRNELINCSNLCCRYLNLLPIVGRVQKILAPIIKSTAFDLKLSLKTFSTNEGIVLIRDYLIDHSNDSYNLAIDLCNICKVDSHQVSLKWGINLIRVGQFEEARVKLEKSFKDFNNVETLNMVINELEGACLRPSLSLNDLRKIHSQMTYDLMKSTLYKEEISLKSKKTASNDAITNFKNETKILLTEGLYYINLYGNPELLVSFLVKHGGDVKDIVRIILHHSLKEDFFVNQVLENMFQGSFNNISFISDLLSVFLQHMNANGVENALVKGYIKATKVFLFKQNKLLELRLVQNFQKDIQGQAVTSIALFAQISASLLPEDIIKQDLYLGDAINLYEKMLEFSDDTNISVFPSSNINNNSSHNNGLKVNDIKAILRRLAIQLQANLYLRIEKFLPLVILTENVSTTFKIPNLGHHQELATAIVLLYNFSLGMNMIKVFNLPQIKVFAKAIIYIDENYKDDEENRLKMFDLYLENIKNVLNKNEMGFLQSIINGGNNDNNNNNNNTNNNNNINNNNNNEREKVQNPSKIFSKFFNDCSKI